MAIIYKKDIYLLNEKKYIQIGIRNVDNEIFKQIVEIFKKNYAFYLPEVKSWFIREYRWNNLEKVIKEKIETLLDDIDSVREELLTEVAKKMRKSLELDEMKEEDYGDEFRKIKAEMMVKFNRECQICKGYATICHHIIPTLFKGETKKENLILLCEKCHGKLHAFYKNNAQKKCFSKDKKYFHKCLDELKKEFEEIKENL